MNWTLFDFLFAGVLLGAVAFAFACLFRLKRSRAYRAGLFLFILTSVAVVWVSGAVGIVGAPGNIANKLFLGALAAVCVGALLFRFRSNWLSRLLSGLALAFMFIAGASLLLGWGQAGGAWPWDVVIAASVFAVLWQISAWLFGLDADIRTLRSSQR